MPQPSLPRTIQIFLLFILVIGGLYFAKPFLVPLAIAGIIAMLMLPLNAWLEKKGWNRGVASLVSVFVVVLAIAGVGFLLAWQVADLAQDMSKMQEFAGKSLSKLKSTVSTNLGISEQKQQELVKQQQSQGSGGAGKMIALVMGGISGMLVNTILVLVYTFLLIYLRGHLKQFLLKLTPVSAKPGMKDIISESASVARSYLSGLAKMIVVLWIMYGIGFSIVGVKNAVFFAMLCGLLEIIPFVGNIAGTLITLLMALSQGGDSNMIIGILITYGLVQFIQTYLLEPLIVGAEVKLNPLFTIIAIVTGEMIWGVPGMILAIPFAGILKVIFDRVEGLKPYGFLLGEEPKPKKPLLLDRFKKKLKS